MAWYILLESSQQGYNFALDLISITSLHTKLWASKVVGILILGTSKLPLKSLGTKWHLIVIPWPSIENTTRGKAVVSPKFEPWWVLWVCSCSWLIRAPKWSSYALTNLFGVATLLWPSVGVKPNTWKSEDLESFGTPECLELNSRIQNTFHWGVLSVIGKVLKPKYRKWPCIGHLDIYSPSYGQKKGRESNWQFDSRPLKVRIRPLPTSEWGVQYVVGKILTRDTSLA
jgi:hypothetical protein